MTLGRAPRQAGLLSSTTSFCGDLVAPDSIYGLLHRDCERLFPDEMFADLFTDVGRRSVPPMIVATVMVLQRIEGLSDREAVDRFTFDARWKYAAGGLDFDYPGFVHTVLVDMRARLAASDAPDRIFEKVLDVCRAAGLVGRKRVLDSTPLYDAVATMDTVTLVRSAIRGVLRCAGEFGPAVRAVLCRDDDYATPGKPACDWDDKTARSVLVDELAKDGRAVLAVLDGLELSAALARAGELLATVLGQDLDCGGDGVFRIARRVAKDRVISTVDPQARHGHKTAARSFDGYKGHIGIDPDSEIITATDVTAGNTGDADSAAKLIADLIDEPDTVDGHGVPGAADDVQDGPAAAETGAGGDGPGINDGPVADGGKDAGQPDAAESPADQPVDDDPAAVYGDNAYGTGAFHDLLDEAGIDDKCKTQRPVNRGGRYAKSDFDVDLDAGQVTCPAGRTASIRRNKHGAGVARFGGLCAGCPLRDMCTTAKTGRSIMVSVYERQLAAARARQRHPGWADDYRATRPKVERKIGHLMRRKHGGRRARVRGLAKVAADFALLAASVNLARLAVLSQAG